MPPQLKFHKRFDFSQLPKDWTVSRVAIDWKGSPLVLVEEGKSPYPNVNASPDARITWLNTAPKAHHLIHWDGFAFASAILGQRGGIARAMKLPAERRREIAREGGVARWSRKP